MSFFVPHLSQEVFVVTSEGRVKIFPELNYDTQKPFLQRAFMSTYYYSCTNITAVSHYTTIERLANNVRL